MLSSISTQFSLTNLFGKLDSSKKGYLDTSDFLSSTGLKSSAENLVTALDGDGDGKVSESEFSNTIDSLLSKLEASKSSSQPPPPPKDSGLTKDEMSQRVSDATSSGDTQQASFLTSVLENFDSADTNGDGRVTFDEAKSFSDSSSTGSTNANQTDVTKTMDPSVIRDLLHVLAAYGADKTQTRSSISINV